MSNLKTAYGAQWKPEANPLKIDFWALKQTNEYLKSVKSSRLEVYLAIHRKLWPEDVQHRWFVLGMKGIVENKIFCMLGCASSGKSHLMATHALITFFAFPNTFFGLISSTDLKSLDNKFWGRMKSLFNRARKRYEWLPGYVVNSKRSIIPSETDEENYIAQETDRGITCVPCRSGGRFVGMGRFQGAKPPHSPGKFDGKLFHYGDEAGIMERPFLDAYTNWMVNQGDSFKGVMAGNPTDICDPLCIASEPVGGWDVFEDNGKTQEWKSKWYGAHCIAFDGRDTPNKDEPQNNFPFLASADWVDTLLRTHGEDSWEVWQQGIGKPSRGMVTNRVITIGMCEAGNAFDSVVWEGASRVRLYALDIAYGGGDRCVGIELAFGSDVNRRQILLVGEPEILPIKINPKVIPEDQIAALVKGISSSRGIPAENIFYDSFGRGTVGFSFAKEFGSTCPVPIDSGAKPTARPVRFDLFIAEDRNGRMDRRLKRCDEHYSKFVSEMWYSTREAVQSGQIRGLKRAIAEEGQMRLFSIVSGNKVEVESKDKMKERLHTSKSPDLMDCLALGVEGARRLGFRIQRLGQEVEEMKPSDLSKLRLAGERIREMKQKQRLVYS